MRTWETFPRDVKLLRLLRGALLTLLSLVVLALTGLLGLSTFSGASPQSLVVRAGVQLSQALEELRYPVAIGQTELPSSQLAITHGVASGDVGATSAVIWSRASRAARVHVAYGPAGGSLELTEVANAAEDRDFTVQVSLAGLRPNTRYTYQVWLEVNGARSEPVEGAFRTAPDPEIGGPVSLVFSGDLGGSHYCRRVDRGYEFFSAMHALQPDFFIAMGDMIYADQICPANGPDGWTNVPGDFRDVDHSAVNWLNHAQLRDLYLRHWRYNRADPHFQALLAGTPLLVTLDDHEVINNSGGAWSYWDPVNRDRAGYPNLVTEGRAAFFDYQPIARVLEDPDRIYRSVRWGKELELFILDTRSYRSRNDLPDSAEAGKTMLGSAQLKWLKEGLRASDATWKVVVSSVTLSFPTGGQAEPVIGRDGWANGAADPDPARSGFERELLDLLTTLDSCHTQNLVFLTGDVHRAASLRYEIDLNRDGNPLRFHELVAGPLSAGRSPTAGVQLDPTLRPHLLYLEGSLFNFGYLRLQPQSDGAYHLLVDTRAEDGQPRPGSGLDLTPTFEQGGC